MNLFKSFTLSVRNKSEHSLLNNLIVTVLAIIVIVYTYYSFSLLGFIDNNLSTVCCIGFKCFFWAFIIQSLIHIRFGLENILLDYVHNVYSRHFSLISIDLILISIGMSILVYCI